MVARGWGWENKREFGKSVHSVSYKIRSEDLTYNMVTIADNTVEIY